MNSLYNQTPIVQSLHGPKECKIFLKLENTQPSGSFKTRGISYHCTKLKERGCKFFVSSSGGNAGLAVAYSGRVLNITVCVFVPTTTPNHVIERLRNEGAEVKQKGDVWDETNKYAIEFVESMKDKNASLVHPFNHPEIWTGHSTIVSELKEQLIDKPSVIVLSVGGGGLLCGVVEGLQKVGWDHVPVIACETFGADSLNQAMKNNKLTTLPAIKSIAKSLGALTVAQEALDWTNKHKILPVQVTDQETISACYKYLNDFKSLVEPACGASLTLMYSDILQKLLEQGKLSNIDSVVIIVCGGHSLTIDNLLAWKKEFNV
eukprot:TCONS_00011699-protein